METFFTDVDRINKEIIILYVNVALVAFLQQEQVSHLSDKGESLFANPYFFEKGIISIKIF